MEPVDPRVDPSLLPAGSAASVLAEHSSVFKPLPSVTTPSGKVITRWSLTHADRMAIVRGDDIYITLMSSEGVISPLWASVGVDPANWK
jgi:hypothetical protein